jgi:hypothetical protein
LLGIFWLAERRSAEMKKILDNLLHHAQAQTPKWMGCKMSCPFTLKLFNAYESLRGHFSQFVWQDRR